MKKNQLNKSGFSLVETLVSITILLVVIVGPMRISSTAAKKTNFSSEQVVAFLLAQEGAEIAQRARDDLMLSNFPSDTTSGWNTFKSETGFYADCFNSSFGCSLELDGTDSLGKIKTPVLCNLWTKCRLYYNESGGRVHYTNSSDGTVKEPYTRVIKFKNNPAYQDEVQVISTVTWNTDSNFDMQKVEVVTYLYKVY